MSRPAVWVLGALGLGAAGFLIVWLGLVPVAASSGHWAITDWFLHFTMRQSVKTRSLAIQAPPLTDPALALRGAGHYESGCAPCHGAPGIKPSAVINHMSPPPPLLASIIRKWEPEELFWVVKHGVKFTGMPSWVTQQRDDEVWAMVAFLLRLPGMTGDQYARLAHGEPESETDEGRRLDSLPQAIENALAECARCHRRDGTGRGEGAFPSLAGQSEQYLFASLQAYADGFRHSGIMQPVAAALDQDTMRELARHYAASRAPARVVTPADPASIRRGEQIAKRGAAQQGVPSCIHCHGPTERARNPYYPLLAGQYPQYLLTQLELFQQNHRGGSPFSPVMNAAAHRLKRDQMRDVAAYYASLRPESAAPNERRD